MAITNGYCTLVEFKARGDISSIDTTRDTFIEQMVDAASRWIDHYTGRQFYAASVTRYFTAVDVYTVLVPDLLSVTALKTDADGDRIYEDTWEATDYDLMPFNDTPYQWLEVTPNGARTFPLLNKGVEIAGSWGYASSAPHAVREACLLYAARLYARKDAVLGVSGNSALGEITTAVPADKDVERLLQTFKRMTL